MILSQKIQQVCLSHPGPSYSAWEEFCYGVGRWEQKCRLKQLVPRTQCLCHMYFRGFQGILLWIGLNPHKHLECIKWDPGVIFLFFVQKEPSSCMPRLLYDVSPSILEKRFTSEVYSRSGWIQTHPTDIQEWSAKSIALSPELPELIHKEQRDGWVAPSLGSTLIFYHTLVPKSTFSCRM